MQQPKPLTLPQVILIFVWILACLFLGAFARHAVTRANAHEGHDVVSQFYSTWFQPQNRRVSCCNDKDCYATQFRRVDGKWYAQRREDAEWIRVPEEKLEHNALDARDSPDGQGHVCMQAPGYGDTVWCAVLGTGV